MKNIVCKAKESTKPAESPQHAEDAVEDAKDGRPENREDQSSGEEGSSFYDEIFYDAVSDNTFTTPIKADLKVDVRLL